MKNTSYTVDEAKKKLEHYCSYQERCHQEVENKLKEMKMISLAQESIIEHLLKHDFLNEERFAQTFARGKFRIKKWGKMRIIRELKFKNITEYNIKNALKEIDDDEYYSTFNTLAEKRFLVLKESNSYKKRKKLTNYLMYRGWESSLIYEKVQELIPLKF